jgi:hypothetical protein
VPPTNLVLPPVLTSCELSCQSTPSAINPPVVSVWRYTTSTVWGRVSLHVLLCCNTARVPLLVVHQQTLLSPLGRNSNTREDSHHMPIRWKLSMNSANDMAKHCNVYRQLLHSSMSQSCCLCAPLCRCASAGVKPCQQLAVRCVPLHGR